MDPALQFVVTVVAVHLHAKRIARVDVVGCLRGGRSTPDTAAARGEPWKTESVSRTVNPSLAYNDNDR